MDMTPIASGAQERHPAARAAIQRWHELKGERSEHEQMWEDIARLIRPQRGGFGLSNPEDRLHEKPLTSAPILAQTNFASGLYGNISNPANAWFSLETPDDEANRAQPVAEWLDIASRRVRNSFLPSASGFYPATAQLYSDLAAFGNGAAYDEIDTARRRFRDVTLSLAEVVYDIDAWGHVWEVVRSFRVSPKAAVEMFGAEALPPAVVDRAEKGQTEKVQFYHHVGRNVDFRRGALGPRGKPWFSHYACELGETLVRRAGYDEMPFYAPRWEVDSGHTYGTGPGFVALASARLLHQMHGATIRAAQWQADPATLAPDRESWPLTGQLRPGRVVYSGLNMQGQQMVRPYAPVGNVGLSIEEKRQIVEEIKDAFHYSLMSLQGRTGMTATEVMAIEEERMRLWAPHTGRIQEEYLARKVERRFQMLWRAGQLPPPPPEAEGLALQVRYTSAAAMAARAREGLAITQFIQNLAPLAQVDPRYLDRLDPDATIEALHEASPVLPARMLRSREEADQLAQQRAQMQQAQMAMQAAQVAGGVARDVAGAQGAMDQAAGAAG